MNRLLKGHVWHRRNGKPANEFRYPVLYVDLDLDSIGITTESLRLMSHNGLNVYAINDSDHYTDSNTGVAASIKQQFMAQVNANPVNVRMLTQPSCFGYVFNPVSFYIASGHPDEPPYVIAEVHNRVGQRHLYHMNRASGPDGNPAHFPKEFYVSPFLEMNGHYEFRMTETESTSVFQFDLYNEQHLVLETALNLKARPLSDWELAKAMISRPLTPQRTVAYIYWQALKLKLRGLPYLRPPRSDSRDEQNG